MLKVVLSLLFAAFALTTALPLRNRFYDDIDDYKRDFLPKKASDFYESMYDEYLRRREPAKLNEGLYKASLDFVSRPYIFYSLHVVVYFSFTGLLEDFPAHKSSYYLDDPGRL